MKKTLNLPREVAESEKANLTPAEMNILDTLCSVYLDFKNYASKNEGWFYKTQKAIFEESNLEPDEGKEALKSLEKKKLIERKAGEGRQCTMYRLHDGIVQLLNNKNGDQSKVAKPKAPVSFDSYCDELPFNMSSNEEVLKTFKLWKTEIDECATEAEIMEVSRRYNKFHMFHLDNKTDFRKLSVDMRQKELQLKGWFQDSVFQLKETETKPMFEFITALTNGVPADEIMELQTTVDQFIDDTDTFVHKWNVKKLAERRLKKIARLRRLTN